MKKFFTLISIILLSVAASSAGVGDVRWHNEANDTIEITNILKDVAGREFQSASARTGYIARMFIGRPYVAHTLEGDEEKLTVNLDELDCTTFVDVVLALSYTAAERRDGWQDFLFNLQRMRYRNGEVDGYASRLHYNCDWAVDNIHRGNLIDVVRNMPRCAYMTRSIDFMSAHRDKYPALTDSTEFERIKIAEDGYRNHRFPYIKTSELTSREVKATLRDGDVLAFVSNRKDLDVTHLGFVVKENGELYALHASSTDGVVEISKAPLADFVKRNRYWIGVRVYRLAE